MMKPLDNIRIVLNNTSHPGNIGAIARAMKNMGLTKLYLVSPKIFPSAEATARASGAEDVLAGAVVCESLQEALADCELVMGCSARSRARNWPMMNPRQTAEQALSYAQSGAVAILFGNEQSGLSNEDLALCQYQCTIPTVDDFSSLNLSQAVQVIAYELYMTVSQGQLPKQNSEKLATVAELDMLQEHLLAYLTQIGFYKPNKSATLMYRIQRFFARIRMEHEEVQVLRGILNATQKHLTTHER